MTLTAMFFPTLLVSLLCFKGGKAVPFIQDQLQSNEKCIQINDERIDEIEQIGQELSNFFDKIANEHRYFNLKLIKVDIEKYVESKNEKPILELIVNDCDKKIDFYHFSNGLTAELRDKDAINDGKSGTEENKSQTNSNISTKNYRRYRHQVTAKQDSLIDSISQNNLMDKKTLITLVRKKKSVDNQLNTNYDDKTLDEVSSQNSNLNSNQNIQSIERAVDKSNFSQKSQKTVVSSEDSTVVNSVSTTNIIHNNDSIQSRDAAYLEQNTAIEADSTLNQSTTNIENNKEIIERSESVISKNNDRSTDHITDNNEYYAHNIAQTAGYVENNKHSLSQSTNNNVFEDKVLQSTGYVEKSNAYTRNFSESINKNTHSNTLSTSGNNKLHNDKISPVSSRHHHHRQNNILPSENNNLRTNKLPPIANNNSNPEKLRSSSNNDLSSEKLLTSGNNNLNKDELPPSANDNFNPEILSPSANNNLHSNKSPYYTSEKDSNTFSQSTNYKNKLTKDDSNRFSSNSPFWPINRNNIKNYPRSYTASDINENYYNSEENELLQSLRHLIRKEIISLSEDDVANYDTDMNYDIIYEKTDSPRLVRIALPEDVLRLKHHIDRKRGKESSGNPMLVYIKQANDRCGQQNIVLL